MRYRRVRVAGGTYFFTVVTHDRRPFLCEPENIDLLRKAFGHVMATHPFTIDAISILPDHIHSIWTLPSGDSNFSTRWRLVKSYFTRHCQKKYRHLDSINKSKQFGNVGFGNIKLETSGILHIILIIFIIIPSNMV